MQEVIESLTLRFNGDDDIVLATLSESLNCTLNCLKYIGDEILTENDRK